MGNSEIRQKQSIIESENLHKKCIIEDKKQPNLVRDRKEFSYIQNINISNGQDILNTLPFHVMLIDKEHKILFANKVAQSELGVCLEEIIGRYFYKILHKADIPIEECQLKMARDNNDAVEREYFDKYNKKWFLSTVYICENTEGMQDMYMHILRDITDNKKAQKELEENYLNFKKATNVGIEALIKTVEKRDPYTAGHQLNVSELAYKIAIEMKLSKDVAEGIRIAGLLHDIGKIAVPIEILCKPGKINIHEFNIIKNHPITGYEIFKDIELPWPIEKAILQHHERINGSGYPYGLLGKDIVLEAKILSVADVVEAMSSHRPYRAAIGIKGALEEINKNKNILYDVDVVEACLKIFKEKRFEFKKLDYY